MRALVVGGGAFGVASAVELRRRGHEVVLVEAGPLPHPDAASTDLSKLVRCDYGQDALYTEWMQVALARWREWNARWSGEGGRALFHETGILLLSSEPMAPGGFEYDSHALLSGMGHALERVDSAWLARSCPAFKEGRFVDGYRNPIGGWAESGAVVAAEARRARRMGVTIEEGFGVDAFVERGGRVVGVRSTAGRALEADVVVVAAGTWITTLLPELSDRLRSNGHPVFVFRPVDVTPFVAPTFLPWAADIGRTGWYGFSANADGLVKVSNHGVGVAQAPEAPRVVGATEEARFRAFLRHSIPGLADAPVAFSRLCFYSDTFDGDFVVARHPDREGVVVATGDSGHAFKFTPVIGDLVADVVEGRPHPFAERFRWREFGTARSEQARCGV